MTTGKLPQVSWIVAPEAYTEHPNWPANYGAWYVSQILDALTANPEVWSKTAFFLMYDENDGFFDHMVPPTPPQSRAQGLSTVDTTNEIFAGNASFAAGPYGLGVRVPMIVISPWSKGGWVSSEVFDHTSLIQFIEQRFAHEHPELIEPNITPWRRAVSGDLTSAFNFKSPNDRGSLHELKVLPSTAGLRAARQRPPSRLLAAGAGDAGAAGAGAGHAAGARGAVRAARRAARPTSTTSTVKLHFANTGKAAAVFQVRGGQQRGDGPWTYTVGPGAHLSDIWTFADGQRLRPVGLRPERLPARVPRQPRRAATRRTSTVRSRYDASAAGSRSTSQNQGASHAKVRILDVYTNEAVVHAMQLGRELHPALRRSTARSAGTTS